MFSLNKVINSYSLIGIILILMFSYWSRINMIQILDVLVYFKIFFLACIILILPDLIAEKIANKKWFFSTEFYSIIILLFFGITGFVIIKNSYFPVLFIFILGLLLIIWNVFSSFKTIKILSVISGVLLIGFTTILFYSQGFHSPLFPELIIKGNAHIDVLFHSSISNLIETIGSCSTGIDGVPYINYHWGSHALFAGLKNWVGIDSLMFYNIAYPVIFIPLFFKSFILFVNNYIIYKSKTTLNLLLVITLLILFYSLEIFGFSGAHPMNSESLCISLIFSFFFGSLLLKFSQNEDKRVYFYITSFSILLLISFFKISTGFVITSGIVYLSLRKCFSFRNIIFTIIPAAIIAGLIYVFVFPEARTIIQSTIARRIINFWAVSNGFITIFGGIFLISVILLKNNTFSDKFALFEKIKSKFYIDLEVLLVISLAGIVGGLFATTNPADVFYFSAPQFFITVSFIIFFFHKAFESYKANNIIKNIFLMVIIFGSLISSPKFLFAGYDISKIKREMYPLTDKQNILEQYILELYKLERKDSKSKLCIYIDQSEKWYYSSQEAGEVASALITPAISGIPLVGGLTEAVLNSRYSRSNYYGVYYYKHKGYLHVNSLHSAEEKASIDDFNTLIYFKINDGKLINEIIPVE